MKKNLFLGLLLCLTSVCADAQITLPETVLREVDSLIQISRALSERQDFDNALEINALAKKLTVENLGQETVSYGKFCFNQGRILYLKKDLQMAEKWLLESKNIREKALPRDSADYAYSIHLLGNVYFDLGHFEKAEQFWLQAKDIREKVLGKKDSLYAWSLNNLANVYLELGNYDQCELLHLEAKAIREKILGKDHPNYAASLYNLANLYWRIGNYQKSESYYLEALAIVEKVLAGRHFVRNDQLQYMLDLNNLANLYCRISRYAEAETLQIKAMAIREKVLRKEDPDYTWSMNSLANLYLDMDRYAQAETLFLETKTIIENTIGKEHPYYPLTLNDLAKLYALTGSYKQAETLLFEAKTIQEKILGKKHQDYAAILTNLASLYYTMRNYDKAEPVFEELANLNQFLITQSLHHLSEGELNNYLHTFSTSQNQILSFAQISTNRKTHISQVSYDNSLFYKGFLLHAAGQIKRLALSDSSTTEKFNLLKSYERRLGAEYSKPIVDRDSAHIADLEEKTNTLEKYLAQMVVGYGEIMRQVKWQEVQATLKPGEAAVEFVHYQYFTPNETDSIMYAALVLLPGDAQPKFIPLFEEKELTPLLRGASGGSNFLKINALYASKKSVGNSKSLYNLIWQPLESILQGVPTVYCSPSGLLHRINFAAIPDSHGKIFGDLRQVILLGSTRQLITPTSDAKNTPNTAYLAGGIRYVTDSTAIAHANRGTSSGGFELSGAPKFHPDSTGTRGVPLEYLPATAAEVHSIGQMLTAANITARVDTGFYATEEAFRQLGEKSLSPRIIHLATHGYFFPDPANKGKANSNFSQEPVFKISEHPMIRSGLIMAGAEQAWLTGRHPQNQEDGILTAYEISQMNLSNTELVVLSACETGLGDIIGNEGVFGLQRAFKIAGAKYLMMSLWKVDDRSTQEFMTTFYKHWLTEKQNIPQAFRITQREMRAKYPGAYDWAGFVLIE